MSPDQHEKAANAAETKKAVEAREKIDKAEAARRHAEYFTFKEGGRSPTDSSAPADPVQQNDPHYSAPIKRDRPLSPTQANREGLPCQQTLPCLAKQKSSSSGIGSGSDAVAFATHTTDGVSADRWLNGRAWFAVVGTLAHYPASRFPSVLRASGGGGSGKEKRGEKRGAQRPRPHTTATGGGPDAWGNRAGNARVPRGQGG